MENTLRPLVEELLELDPSLREHKNEIERCVQEILKKKPNIILDVRFKNELRFLIQKRIQEHKKDISHFPSGFSKILWQNVLSGFGGAILATLVLTPSFYLYYAPKTPVLESRKTMAPLVQTQKIADSQPEMASVSENAVQDQDNLPTKSVSAPIKKGEMFAKKPVVDTAESNAVTPVHDKVETSPSLDMETSAVATGRGGGNAKMVSPDQGFAPQSNLYTLEAENISLPEKELSVFQQGSNPISFADADALLSVLKLEGFQKQKLQNVDIENITLAEKKPFGFIVNIAADGSVSFNQNWRYWEDPLKNCQTPECFQKLQLKITDVPKDEVLLQIAADFVKTYGFDLSHYGKPVIDVSWKQGAESYVPDAINVVYPEMIAGKMVYEQSGTPAGIVVSVNIRLKKVSGMYGLSLQKTLEKKYESIQNEKILQESLQHGGVQNFGGDGSDSKKVSVSDPQMVWVKVWKYNEKTGIGSFYFIPAYKFTSQESHIAPVFVPLVDGFTENRMTILPATEPMAR